MKLIHNIAVLVKEEFRRNKMRRLYKKYRDFTMIQQEDYVDNLIVAKRAGRLRGCVVECGVWRGGMSGGIAEILGPERSYFLFDSFAGLPPTKALDGQRAKLWQSQAPSVTHDNCTASPDFARRAMLMSGAPSFQLVQGWFETTVPSWEPQLIALLRLDGDWYDSTMVCLKHLYDHVVPGGDCD